MDLQTLLIVQPGTMTDMDLFMFECLDYIVIEDVLSPHEIQETFE